MEVKQNDTNKNKISFTRMLSYLMSRSHYTHVHSSMIVKYLNAYYVHFCSVDSFFFVQEVIVGTEVRVEPINDELEVQT
jgi:hypothetical protein